MMKFGPPALELDVDTRVSSEFNNSGLFNSIIHQTFGSSLSVSCIVLTLFLVLMIIAGLLAYSMYRVIWRNEAAIKNIQAYLRAKSSRPQASSSV